MFTPAKLVVKAPARVTWTNDDNILHTVTTGRRLVDPATGLATREDKTGETDMELNRGQSMTHTFTQPGTYHYFCDRHPGMEADIIVN